MPEQGVESPSKTGLVLLTCTSSTAGVYARSFMEPDLPLFVQSRGMRQCIPT